MAYNTDDRSIHDGAPVELYLFEGPSASFTYRYTSAGEDQSYGGNTYTAQPGIRRGAVEVSGIKDARSLSVTLPTGLAVVQDYIPVPPRSLSLTVYRRHQSGDEEQIWSGPVESFSPQGKSTRISVGSRFKSILKQQIPRLRFQTACQHFVYDDNCGLSEGSFTDSDSISSITSSTEVEISNSAGRTSEYVGGKIRRDSDSEERTVVAHSGTTVTFDYPFESLSVSDNVSLVFGCDGTPETCRDTFSNIDNYGPTSPDMPDADIQRATIRGL